MRLSLASNVTENDWNSVNSYNSQLKARVLKLYLLGDNNGKYNTAEVAQKIFGNDDGRLVSAILRCYNIGQKNHRSNSGIYRNSLINGYRVNEDNIEEFVYEYPDGCYPETNFEEWMLDKINEDKARRQEEKRIEEQRKRQEEANRIENERRNNETYINAVSVYEKYSNSDKVNMSELERAAWQLENLGNYKDSKLYITKINYLRACKMIDGNPQSAIRILNKMLDYSDAQEKKKEAAYNYASSIYLNDPQEAIKYFEMAENFKDAKNLLIESRYLYAKKAMEYMPSTALEQLSLIADYKDSSELIAYCKNREEELDKLNEIDAKREMIRKIVIAITTILSIIIVIRLYLFAIA